MFSFCKKLKLDKLARWIKTSVGCFNSPSFCRNVRNHFLCRKASFSLIRLSQAVPTCKRNAEIILCSLFCHFIFKEAFKSSSKALSLTQAKLMLCHQNYKRRKEGKGTSKYHRYDLYVKAFQKLVTLKKKKKLRKRWVSIRVSRFVPSIYGAKGKKY